MTKTIASLPEILSLIEEAGNSILAVLRQFDDEEINRVPFAGSWTAAQVADHVTKSNISIARALGLSGVSVSREKDERLDELKTVFLDFSTKLKSPDFILPSQDRYVKEVVIAHLNHSISKLKEVVAKQDLTILITHPAFGDITKYEITFFVLFHTQRHTRQVNRILDVIKNR